MNELICEMCGSNNVIKQDGLFICQSCNTKYSMEEARKIMAGEKVEVEGTVKIDTSSELENLYELARRAKDTNNNENALKYYDQILVKEPNSWEAQFYVVYFKSMGCKIAEISSAAVDVNNCLKPVLNLVKDNIADTDEQENIITEIVDRIITITEMLDNAARNHFNGINPRIQNKFVQKYVNNVFSVIYLLYNLGDNLIEIFGETYKDYSIGLWKLGIAKHQRIFGLLTDKKANESRINNYVAKIQKYEPTYEKPKLNKGGCYVATSVYGSYDCPEVWTLRRFRDNTLDNNIFGRLFIKTYYTISPTLVKHFGDKKIFNRIFKPILDRFVKKLNEKGVKSTFYLGK
ncbi:MAG: hypothetical protein E7Z73_01780 [Methanobrevibacter millerae]|uniref:RRN7-type domain-containing protein n=1 Tax=Methanobrevibacter millerae TaxID=230361 RepID=A0A8T3VBD4_9EURY|nr:TFIIB-type zinc finger domain-containing protein [Methanobrevibacter millerae]MBE6504462.1 hypothetical protein [Methanobrevibacter millerae]